MTFLLPRSTCRLLSRRASAQWCTSRFQCRSHAFDRRLLATSSSGRRVCTQVATRFPVAKGQVKSTASTPQRCGIRWSYSTAKHGHQHAMGSDWTQTTHLAAQLQRATSCDLQAALESLPQSARHNLMVAVAATTSAQDRTRARDLFQKVDTNFDGVISKEEFTAWIVAATSCEVPNATAATAAVAVAQPTPSQLVRLGVRHVVPMVGFGFADNLIMITAGENIDSTLGSALHLSTMAAAGLGNLLSDVIGLGLSNSIEAMASKIGLPDPGLTSQQLLLPACRRTTALASMIGITIGCLLGMVPLLFFNEDEKVHGKMFDAIDENGDGHISLEELVAIRPHGMTKDVFLERAHSWGLSDDAYISRSQYLELIRDLNK